MTWTSIRLELARTAEFPDGSPQHAYIIHLPLTGEGLIEGHEVDLHPERATVHRYWGDEYPRSGYVTRTPTGWVFSYERGEADDEAVFHLESHLLQPGNYVTLVDPEGEQIPLRVTDVQPLETK